VRPSGSSSRAPNEVDQGEAQPPHRRLQNGTEDPEREHVEEQVEEARVQEARRDDAPVLAVRNRCARQRAVGQKGTPAQAAAAGGARAAERGAEEHEHVDADQQVGQRRLIRRRARPHRAHPGALVRALGAAHADRCRRHAVRANRPSAVRTVNAGLAVLVAVADLHRAEAQSSWRAHSRGGEQSVSRAGRSGWAARSVRSPRHAVRA
jgi:hypothetical protein